MALLTGFWEFESFRDAVRLLAGLEPDAVALLIEMSDESGFRPLSTLGTDFADRLGLSVTNGRLVAAAARSLHGLAAEAEGGPAEVIDSLVEKFESSETPEVAAQLEVMRELLEELLRERADVVRADRVSAVEDAGLTALEGMSSSVDLRVVPSHFVADGEIRLVPVGILRFEFDEMIASAGASVSCQASRTVLAGLHEQIGELLQRVSEVEDAMRDWMY